MKNFKIFIIVLCCLCLVGVSFFVGFCLPNWTSSQIEQPVSDPPSETPEEPEEPEEPVEKVEITDWVFSENVLGQYIGTETEISNIPTSYSQEEHVSRTVEIKNEEEFYSFVEEFSASDFVYQIPIRVTYLNLDLVKTYENYAIFMNDFEVLAVENNVEDLYLCKFEELDNTFYEGSDYKIDTLGAMTFYFSSATVIDLPAEITKFNAIMLPSTLKSLTIRSDTVLTRAMNNTLGFDDPVDYTIYVPENLVEGYKTTYPRIADSVFPIGYEAPEEMPLPYVIEDGVITAYTGSETEVVIPATYSLSSAGQAIEGSDYTITEIGEEVFKRSTIEKIDMSNSSILKLGNSCFYGSKSLNTVVLSNYLTTIGDSCFYETAIKTIDMPDTVVEIGDFAFFWCSYLNSVTLSNSLESLPRSCFGLCSSLTTIVLPESINSLGEGCFATSSLSSINFPDALTGLPTDCFNACDFVEIDLSDSKITTLGERCFANNELLTNIILNDSITELPKMCFYRCSALSSYEIPSTITAFGDQCFDDCSSLSSIIIPSSVRSWGNYAFANCESLSYVEISYRPSRLPTRLFSYSVNTVVFNDSSFYYDFNPDYTDYQLFKNPSVVKFKSSVDNGSNSWLNENYVKTVEGDYNVYTRIA